MRNTSLAGEVCRTQIIFALTLQGKTVLLPLGDYQRYDLVVEDAGEFLRIQWKMGRLIGEVDLFGGCCPEVKKCYLVPVEVVPATECCLRIVPPKNGQKTGIRWAADSEIRNILCHPLFSSRVQKSLLSDTLSETHFGLWR